MTGVSLAELVGISRQAVSQYENGSTTPTPEVLEKIASRLNLPVAFFLAPARKNDDHAELFFRSLSAATKTARLRERRRFAWHREIVEFVCQYVVLPDVDFPEWELGQPGELDDEAIEELAARTRDFWRLPDGPIADVVELLESHGAIMIRCPLGADSLDAYSAWCDGRPHIILGEDKRSAVRSRYDATHELAHLILHRAVSQTTLNRTGELKEIERQAHLFAGAFLLSSGAFASEVTLPTLDGLLALKPRWGVSVGAMIMRCGRLNLIDDDQQRRLWVGYSSRGWRRREPFDDELPIETPRNLRAAFEMARSARLYTTGQVRVALPYAPTDIEQLAALPQGYLDEARSPIMRPTITTPRLRGTDIPGPAGGEVVSFPTHPSTRESPPPPRS